MAATKEEQKVSSSFNAKARREDLEYLNSGRWKCPNNPEGEAHHFVEVDGELRCKYCPATRDRVPMPAPMKKEEGVREEMIRIEIPMLPRPELNPNARVSPFKRAGATAELRKAAWAIAYNANPAHDIMFEKARIKVTLIYPGHQVVPDPDNLMTMLKPALDGIVDAKIIPNDTQGDVRYVLPMFQEVDSQRAPLTILEVEDDRD